MTLSEEKRGLEIGLWLMNLEKFQDSLKAQDEKIAISRSQYDDAERTLAEIAAETEEIYEKNGALASKIESIRAQISSIDGEIAQKNAQISVARGA